MSLSVICTYICKILNDLHYLWHQSSLRQKSRSWRVRLRLLFNLGITISMLFSYLPFFALAAFAVVLAMGFRCLLPLTISYAPYIG